MIAQFNDDFVLEVIPENKKEEALIKQFYNYKGDTLCKEAISFRALKQ